MKIFPVPGTHRYPKFFKIEQKLEPLRNEYWKKSFISAGKFFWKYKKVYVLHLVSRAQADEREKKRIVNQIKQNMDSQHKTNNQNSNGNQNMNQNQNGGSNDDHTSVIRYVDHSNKEGRKYRSTN